MKSNNNIENIAETNKQFVEHHKMYLSGDSSSYHKLLDHDSHLTLITRAQSCYVPNFFSLFLSRKNKM
jgi:hypothetical protein